MPVRARCREWRIAAEPRRGLRRCWTSWERPYVTSWQSVPEMCFAARPMIVLLRYLMSTSSPRLALRDALRSAERAGLLQQFLQQGLALGIGKHAFAHQGDD